MSILLQQHQNKKLSINFGKHENYLSQKISWRMIEDDIQCGT